MRSLIDSLDGPAAAASTLVVPCCGFTVPSDLGAMHAVQLLGEFDAGLTERLLLSEHREADPRRADYFWLPGPNIEPARKLAHVRRTSGRVSNLEPRTSRRAVLHGALC